MKHTTSRQHREPVGKDNPISRASVLSRAIFGFVEPLLRKRSLGARLEAEDLYQVYPGGACADLTNKLQRNWNQEWASHQKGQPASLIRAVVRTFWKEFAWTQIFCFGEVLGRLMLPVLLSWMLDFFSGKSDITVHQAWTYAAAFCALHLMQAFSGPQVVQSFCIATHRWQYATYGLIYHKVLRVPRHTLGEVTTGYIVDLVNTDTRQYHEVVWYLPCLWFSPFKAAFAFWFLYQRLGLPIVVGYIAILLLGPLQGFVAKMSAKATERKMKSSDKRVQLMSEIISGMRIIKMYCWEKPFGKILSQLRQSELRHWWINRFFCCILAELYTFNFRIISTAVLIAATLLGYDLKAPVIFPMFAMFNVINESLLTMASWGMKSFFEIQVALKRIQTFLLSPEKVSAVDTAPESPGSVHLDHVTAVWDTSQKRNTLEDISLDIRPGQLVAVVGQVGAGKSSLLNLLSDELFMTSGKVTVGGSMAYAPQQPWIFSDTIRENVLIGSEYRPRLLQEVMEVTALGSDLESLTHGDLTRVGERGVMLSGGQKARLSLSRAVYQSADIYLLDDPLSAVDTSVGRHIFDRCIRGYLSGKTRILVTHQLQYIKEADVIVIFDKGRLTMVGNYYDILNSGTDLAKILPAGESEEVVKTDLKHTNTNANLQSIKLTEEDLEQEEERVISTFGWSVYKKFFTSRLKLRHALALVVVNILCQLSFNGADCWLAYWLRLRNNEDFSNNHSDTNYLLIFVTITVSVYLVGLFRSLIFFGCTNKLSQHHHDKMYASVIRSPTRFFDLNPSGRILNRFSIDLAVIDDELPIVMYDFLQQTMFLLGTLCMVIYLFPGIIIPCLVFLLFLGKSRSRFVNTSKDCAMLESTARSPILTHLKASIDGIDTIRALGRQDWCIETFNYLVDRLHGRIWTGLSLYNWYNLRMNLTVTGFTCCTVIAFMMARDHIDHSLLAVAFSYLVSMIWALNTAGRLSADLTNFIGHLERILTYGQLPPEAPLELSNAPNHWPSHGAISMIGVGLKYHEDGPTILEGINISIRAREKIGIVGRTGAGKTSLIQALFRMTEPEGKIYIDGVHTGTLGLHDVRGNISIIPQDPVLFSGAIRQNLDPFHYYSDQQIWKALQEVQLDSVVRDSPGALDSLVTEGGSNYSVGQRQLLCLARAILRHNKILVMDEATANVDTRTDELIQQAIRRTFQDCTVLTVAHRLHTVMDSDRIMVVDAGHVVEFDSPHSLLQNPKGYLTSLVAETGINEENRLRDIAYTTHKIKHR